MDFKTWLKQNYPDAKPAQGSLGGSGWSSVELFDAGDGTRLCVKQSDAAPLDFFRAEAAGLTAMAETNTVRTPAVIHADDNFLVIEFIDSGRRAKDYWQNAGEQLAAMHAQPQPHFGFTMDTYCGLTPQANPAMEDGHRFFGDQRLLPLAQMANEKGLLSKSEVESVEALCKRLPELVPEQPPALLHGDLWSGNIMCDESGQPVLIDPACYWGWPEADLGMTALFGGFSDTFYRAYEAARPLDPGWEERLPLYNLYHLLNHLNLFGSGYYSQVVNILRRY